MLTVDLLDDPSSGKFEKSGFRPLKDHGIKII